MENNNYISKAIPTIIKFSSRASVKVKDSFYTVEYGEERQINDFNNIDYGIDIEKERQLLIDCCNSVVDGQVDEIIKNCM